MLWIHIHRVYPVGCFAGLLDELLDLLDVFRDVADGREVRGEVLHLGQLVLQGRDGVQQVPHYTAKDTIVYQSHEKDTSTPSFVRDLNVTQDNVSGHLESIVSRVPGPLT